jgi:hypothetical protein
MRMMGEAGTVSLPPSMEIPHWRADLFQVYFIYLIWIWLGLFGFSPCGFFFSFQRKTKKKKMMIIRGTSSKPSTRRK